MASSWKSHRHTTFGRVVVERKSVHILFNDPSLNKRAEWILDPNSTCMCTRKCVQVCVLETEEILLGLVHWMPLTYFFCIFLCNKLYALWKCQIILKCIRKWIMFIHNDIIFKAFSICTIYAIPVIHIYTLSQYMGITLMYPL